jgi:tetraacyldisaccharide 4'-kinase
LLELLRHQNSRIAVLTRGYKRQSKEPQILTSKEFLVSQRVAAIGDEPALILQNLKNGVLGVGSERYMVGREIMTQHPVEIFLLDDGFQHRQLYRDLDICLIDVSRWHSHPFLFPFSYLRDSKSSLRRADIIVLTKFDQTPQKAETLKAQFEKKYQVPVLKGEYILKSLKHLNDSETLELEKIRAQKVAAFCGIANPANFFDLLKKHEFKVIYKKAFPDHCDYRLQDIEEFSQRARGAGANWIIVTEKDAVKLKSILSSRTDLGRNLLVLSVSFRFDAESKLTQAINNIIKKTNPE